MDFELAAKIIFGSALFAFLIAEVARSIRRFKIKERIIKEIAFELIFNERIAKMIIEDFQELQKNPCGYLRSHRFFIQIIDSVISSAYFVNLDADLFQLIAEFAQRFRNIQAEQDGFYALENDDKMRNIINLPVHERNARVLLHDLQKSRKFKELKSKHEKEWLNTRKEFINERLYEKGKQLATKLKAREFGMKKDQRIIICIWLIISSILLWHKGIEVELNTTKSGFFYFVIGTALCFAGIFVMTLKKEGKKNIKNKESPNKIKK